MSETPNVLFNVAYAISEAEIAKRPFINEKYKEERIFYSCRKDDDFMKYVDKGIKAGDVIGYASNEEKGKGIFNKHGLLDDLSKKRLRNQLRKTKSNIWHCVLSFKEEFGNQYIDDYQIAQQLLKSELPKFFDKAGLHKDNIIWFAGLHENTDNKHIHICFFEKKPLFKSHNSSELRYSRGVIPYNAIEWFVVDIEKNLTKIGSEFYNYRNSIVQKEKNILTENTDYILKHKLLELYRSLPDTKRIAYQSLNMEHLRPKILELLFFIIKRNPELKNIYSEFTKKLLNADYEIKAICKRQKIIDCSKYLIEEKYLSDLYRRLGNKIIQTAFEIKCKENKETIKAKKQIDKKRIEKKHRNYLFKKAEHLSKEIEENAVMIFEEYELKLQIAEYKRLIEEGVIES